MYTQISVYLDMKLANSHQFSQLLSFFRHPAVAGNNVLAFYMMNTTNKHVLFPIKKGP